MSNFQHCVSCGETHHRMSRRQRQIDTFVGHGAASFCLKRFFDRNHPVEIIDEFFTSLPKSEKLVREVRLLPPLKKRRGSLRLHSACFK